MVEVATVSESKSNRNKELDTTIRQIAKCLKLRYKTPDLGNLNDPLDELVFILSTFKTNATNYRPVFTSLRKAFPSWDDLLASPPEELRALLKPAGLSNQKAPRLVDILRRIKTERGTLSLDFLENLPDAKVEEYLTSFNGIGKKGARCIMMYSLGRKVFPVDTHTVRIFKRLGLLDSVVKPKPAQDIIQNMVPRQVRRDLHVNLIAHGRATCLAKKPKCNECCIDEYCEAHLQPKASRG